MKILHYKYLIFSLQLVAVLFSQPSAEATRTANEEELKAAFVFRFAQYTTWPRPLEEELRLCLFGQSKVSDAIEEYSGRSIQGRSLITVRVSSATIPENSCDAAFISTKNRKELRNLINSRGDQSTLLISDNPEAFEERTDIALTTEPNKVTFSINLTEAKDRNFSFSGQMLKLAQRVR